MTDQEKANKKEARRLIKLSDRPDNVKRVSYGKTTHYRVNFGEIDVCFMFDGKRLLYLGEYPSEEVEE